MKIKTPKGVVVKKSKTGLGVFTNKGFKAGTRVFLVRGEFMTCNEEEDVDERTRSNTIRYDTELYISPTGFTADYLNHSCEPNTKIQKVRKKLFVVAISNIMKGEEVVMDYSTIIASDDTWTMDCRCGKGSCRRQIGQFKKLPKKLKDRYILMGIVPKYILET